jgi:hypothetical protein
LVGLAIPLDRTHVIVRIAIPAGKSHR